MPFKLTSKELVGSPNAIQKCALAQALGVFCYCSSSDLYCLQAIFAKKHIIVLILGTITAMAAASLNIVGSVLGINTYTIIGNIFWVLDGKSLVPFISALYQKST